MIKNLLCISILTIAITVNSQTLVPGGNVTGTWGVSGSPYLINGDIIVPNDSILIIQAGVTIYFQGHFKFLILGRLLATGTETDSIICTANNCNTGWYGIRFDSTNVSNDSSVIEFCRISCGMATD